MTTKHTPELILALHRGEQAANVCAAHDPENRAYWFGEAARCKAAERLAVDLLAALEACVKAIGPLPGLTTGWTPATWPPLAEAYEQARAVLKLAKGE